MEKVNLVVDKQTAETVEYVANHIGKSIDELIVNAVVIVAAVAQGRFVVMDTLTGEICGPERQNEN